MHHCSGSARRRQRVPKVRTPRPASAGVRDTLLLTSPAAVSHTHTHTCTYTLPTVTDSDKICEQFRLDANALAAEAQRFLVDSTTSGDAPASARFEALELLLQRTAVGLKK